MSPNLTLKEASERLRVAPRTLLGWCATGKIAHVRLPNRRVLIPESEVERVLAVKPATSRAAS